MKTHNVSHHCAFRVLGILAVCMAASAVPPTTALEEVRALEPSGDPELETSLSAVVDNALRAFDAPVNLEIHPTYGRSTPSTVEELPFAVKHAVQKNESLAHCLDELIELSRGLLEVQNILGNTCIVPRKVNKEEILTNLDVQVSLHVKEVSTWEALKALGIEVNRADATEYSLLVTLACIDQGFNPPDALTQESVVSVSLDNVQARFALCAIMNASPLELSYIYVCGAKAHGATDKLVVSVHENGKRISEGEPLTSKDWQWWEREKGEVGWEKDR
ncbi:MAG: hypothetical protein AMXMBFR82_18850 [Candidatus Hydrogenedentota bacterium]